ncbi:hypothetical protein N7456_011587 [Penicillium angulare]|uniref:Zn(2)-C6 fungal-type domain-containing protein n=1 Tax=Penicillium angulare TaxID=116970 RepID=A0A9W9EUA1_9EURO|nr:hypothetical protein N7456_011587 [Penicillium angulare]
MSSFPSSSDRDKQWGVGPGRSFQQYEPSSFAEDLATRAPHNVTPGLSHHDWSDPSGKRSIDRIIQSEDYERSHGKVESLSDSQALSNDSGNEDDPEEKHRESKRPRMAISCSECRRRKIKCDRNIPCMACVRRGMPGSCRWENAKVEPSPQPFALKTQVDDLQRQLESLQETLKTLPAEVVKAVTMAQQPSNSNTSPSKQGIEHQDPREAFPRDTQISKGGVSSNGNNHTSSRLSANALNATSSATRSNAPPPKGLSAFYDDAAENAAVVLESIAFNPQTNEADAGNDSMISHEYWRGNMLTPISGAALAGSAKDDPPKLRHQLEQQNQEYTSALTSIVAPPWDITLDRFNPVLMQQGGSEPDTPQHLMRHKLDAMHSIFENLPSLSQSYYLAEQYKNIIHWRSRILQ